MPRRTKAQLFENDREEIFIKMLEILRITDENRFIIVDDISDEQINNIKALVPKIKKSFAYNEWPYFKRNSTISSLIKSLVVEMGHNCNSSYIIDCKSKDKMKALHIPRF